MSDKDETILTWRRDFVARFADKPCCCEQLPDDLPDEITCAPCTARAMQETL